MSTAAQDLKKAQQERVAYDIREAITGLAEVIARAQALKDQLEAGFNRGTSPGFGASWNMAAPGPHASISGSYYLAAPAVDVECRLSAAYARLTA